MVWLQAIEHDTFLQISAFIFEEVGVKKRGFFKINSREIKHEDLLGYKQKVKKLQEALLVEMMEGDEEVGLYEL